MRIWFDVVTRRDAVLLVRWWNRHTIYQFTVRRSQINPRYWAVIKE